MLYRFTIPNFLPVRLNQFVGRHWSVGHRLKRADRALVQYYAKIAGVPPAEGKRRVSMVLTLAPRQRGPDPDSMWKGLLDNLVGSQLLRDDSRQWCELGSVEYRRGPERATEVVLEDLKPTPAP